MHHLVELLMQISPTLKIDWSISLGSIVTTVTLIGIALVYHRKVVVLLLEHEVLKSDYCSRHGLEREDFFLGTSTSPKAKAHSAGK